MKFVIFPDLEHKCFVVCSICFNFKMDHSDANGVYSFKSNNPSALERHQIEKNLLKSAFQTKCTKSLQNHICQFIWKRD